MVLTHFPEYELSARRVLRALGFEVGEPESFACCSSVFLPSVSDAWLNFAAYTLAQARGYEGIVTLCGTCTAMLRRGVVALRDEATRRRVNGVLSSAGLTYTSEPRVVHLLELLDERAEQLSEMVVRPRKVRVAVQNPCNLRIPGLTEMREDALTRVVTAAGAEVVGIEDECCGSALVLESQKLAEAAGRRRLEQAEAAGAEGVVVACGNCAYLLERQLGGRVLFFSQLVAEALGLEVGAHA